LICGGGCVGRAGFDALSLSLGLSPRFDEKSGMSRGDRFFIWSLRNGATPFDIDARFKHH
jgi:hypothetical protein